MRSEKLASTKNGPALGVAAEADLSLQHLQAELARIDVLIRREVRRWQLAGQDPHDYFRGLSISDDEVRALLERPPGTSWGQTITLDPGEEQAFAQAEAEARHHCQVIATAARRKGQALRLEHLASVFGLEPFDRDALLICLAPALDLRYERLYGYLQDDVTRKRASVNLALDLLCPSGPERLLKLARFSDGGPLLRYGLLTRVAEPEPARPSPLNVGLAPDETVMAWLLGHYPPRVGAEANLIPPRTDETDRRLAAEAAADLLATASANPILVFHGPDLLAQQAAARLLAAQLGCPLLSVDLESATSDGRAPLHILRLALRDARLTGAIPLLRGWQTGLGTQATWSAGLLAELSDHPGPVILAGLDGWQPGHGAQERLVLQVEFPVPEYPSRRQLWAHFLGAGAQTIPADRLDVLAGQFLLTSDQIRNAVATARALAARRGEALGDRDLFAAARIHSSRHLSGLARKITPRYAWDDLILPTDQLKLLHEAVDTVRGRPQVLQAWGVGRKLASSSGVTLLFAGPPGTGKTMAAEVIAAELGLELYLIDLSTVVSKYIGETEKNLERIFSEAQSSNAILFFDEADAIFGKRSEVKDAHDRYANIEISYLLQRMEAYDGVTILATNLRANLDEAFTRRLQFVVDFPFPDEAQRLRIWQTLFPPGVPRAPDLDLARLAKRYKFSGGNIRNAIVAAAYLAAASDGQVTMLHLQHGIRRELQKMGRLLDEID